MNKRNTAIIIIVVILSLLVAGAFWFEKKKSSSIVTDPKKEFTAVEGEEGYVWFPVPELGIEIKVNKDIAPELVYQIKKPQPDKDIVSTQFTTTRLLGIGKKNGLETYDSRGNYTCDAGFFTRYNMSQQELEALPEYEYIIARGVSLDGYFIEYAGSQSSCSYSPNDKNYNASDGEYVNYLSTNWFGRSRSEYRIGDDELKNLQQSVRRIKGEKSDNQDTTILKPSEEYTIRPDFSKAQTFKKTLVLQKGVSVRHDDSWTEKKESGAFVIGALLKTINGRSYMIGFQENGGEYLSPPDIQSTDVEADSYAEIQINGRPHFIQVSSSVSSDGRNDFAYVVSLCPGTHKACSPPLGKNYLFVSLHQNVPGAQEIVSLDFSRKDDQQILAEFAEIASTLHY